MDNLEQRVWGRVLAQPEEVPENIGELILASRELAAVYGRLAKNAGEKTKHLLKQLQQEEMKILHSLLGISRLRGREIQLRPLPVPKEPAASMLETCYYRSLRARQEYMAWSAGGTCGEVFRILADRAGAQCARIAEVLGIL